MHPAFDEEVVLPVSGRPLVAPPERDYTEYDALTKGGDDVESRAQRAAEFTMARRRALADLEKDESAARPTSFTDRSANELRPEYFADMVGQAHTKALLQRIVTRALHTTQPLDHVLMVGKSGTGKTTLANVIAHELGVDVYQLQAPISFDTLMDLREVMGDRDVLFLDEIHQQAIQERRGKESITQPEVLFAVMEDRTIATPNGVLPFPAITLIGATTDEGMLPEPFLNRFPLRPHLEAYSALELELIANNNAKALSISLTKAAAQTFAGASRGIPRQINNYMRNAAMLTASGRVTKPEAVEVVVELNRTTLDGLTADQQGMLTFLFTRGKRTSKDGTTTYQASVNTIATAIGKGRDTKVIQLRVEPYLIERGYVQVGHQGRLLTDDGIKRAKTLTGGKP